MLTISDNVLHCSNKVQRKNVAIFNTRSLTTKHKTKQSRALSIGEILNLTKMN